MTRQVNLYEAKTKLSQLVEDAANGEEIIIAKNGKPMAKLVVVALPEGRRNASWVSGPISSILTTSAPRKSGCATGRPLTRKSNAISKRASMKIGEIRRTMGRYLLDSHVFLWAKRASSKLRGAARSEIEKAENTIFVSAVGLWELADKASKKKAA